MSESMPTASTPGTGGNSSATPTSSAPAQTTTTTSAPTKTPATAPSKSTTPADTTTSEPKQYQFKVKINGKERVIKGTEAEITTYLQKAEASDEKFRKAKEIEKKFMELTTYAQQDPERARQAYKELFGRDFTEDAEAYLASKYEESTLSDEEKARRKELEEAKQAQKKLKEYETREQEAKRKQQEDALWSEMEKTYFGALEKLGYDKDPAILTLMADIDEAAVAMGFELSDAQLVHEANRRLEQNARHVFKRFTKPGQGPALLEFLGADGVKAVISAEMERRKLASPTPKVTEPETKPRSLTDETKQNKVDLAKRQKDAREAFRRMRFGMDD